MDEDEVTKNIVVDKKKKGNSSSSSNSSSNLVWREFLESMISHVQVRKPKQTKPGCGDTSDSDDNHHQTPDTCASSLASSSSVSSPVAPVAVAVAARAPAPAALPFARRRSLRRWRSGEASTAEAEKESRNSCFFGSKVSTSSSSSSSSARGATMRKSVSSATLTSSEAKKAAAATRTVGRFASRVGKEERKGRKD